MGKFSSPAWMMAAFFAGIFFVYSCGGGGDYANMAIGVQGGLPEITEEVNSLKQQVADLEKKLAAITDDGTTLMIAGRNVQIVSGSGATDDNGALTSLGNLIVGYNEDSSGSIRTGSHNLIVGIDHDYTSYGGLVAGNDNTISGVLTVVAGGRGGTASGEYASVSGGDRNTASGFASSVSGGNRNIASGQLTNVSGGRSNNATGVAASVSGGRFQVASGMYATVSGGISNTASGDWSNVSGGQNNTATGEAASVSGGEGNIAGGKTDSVSGGQFCLRNGPNGVSSWGIGGATDAGPASGQNCSVANDNT